MKKLLTIIAVCLIPIFGIAGSCHGDWTLCYNSAESQFAADLVYCSNRAQAGLDTKIFACFRHARYDYDRTVEGCSTAYYYCIIDF